MAWKPGGVISQFRAKDCSESMDCPYAARNQEPTQPVNSGLWDSLFKVYCRFLRSSLACTLQITGGIELTIPLMVPIRF